MIKRPYWISRITSVWEKRPIVWLAGVRRVGKTTLARMLPDTVYLNRAIDSEDRDLPGSLDDLWTKVSPLVLD